MNLVLKYRINIEYRNKWTASIIRFNLDKKPNRPYSITSNSRSYRNNKSNGTYLRLCNNSRE